MLRSAGFRRNCGVVIGSIMSTVAIDAAYAEDAREVLGTVTVQAKRTEKSLSELQAGAPIEVITSEDIQASGSDNLTAVLQRLVPSANIPLGAANTSASSQFAKSVSLHGLGPDETLILVDGKRRHLSASINNSLVFGRGAQVADLNQLPLSAIDRIEVLKDGAAAQYGSDAIAGVVNIILRKDKSGGDISAQAGNYVANDKPEGRPKTSTKYKGWFGTTLGDEGYANFSFDWDKLYSPVEGLPDTRRWYFTGDPREATANKSKWPAHFPADEESYKMAVSAGRDINKVTSIYGFFTHGHSVKAGRNFYILPNADANVRAIYPDGYGATPATTVDDYSGAIGVRHDTIDNGEFDFSINYGSYDQSRQNDIGVNAGLGLNTPIGFNLGGYKNKQLNADLTWNKRITLAGLDNPIKLAAGASARREDWEIVAGEFASYAKGALILDGPNAGRLAPSAGGLTPQDARKLHRTVGGLWLSAENKITQKLTLGAAGRSEHYSDFGTTTTGKLWAKRELLPNLALNGGVSSGYRAPTLGQMGYSTTSYTADNTIRDFVQSRSLAVSDPLAKALGATDLKPEKSTNVEVGVSWQPTNESSISVEAYQVAVKDRITLSENLSGAVVTNLLTAAGSPETRIANFFINALDTRTRGIDLTGKVGFDIFGKDRLELNAGFAYTETTITRIADRPAALQGTNLTLVSRRVQGLFTKATPSNKLVISANYKTGNWDWRVTEKRYGKYTEFHPDNPAFDQTYGAQYLTDVSTTYRSKDGFYFTVGVNNLFDSRPDRQRPELSVGGFAMSKYSDLAPEGMNGTYYYATLGYKF